jgi:hypothetical protein
LEGSVILSDEGIASLTLRLRLRLRSARTARNDTKTSVTARNEAVSSQWEIASDERQWRPRNDTMSEEIPSLTLRLRSSLLLVAPLSADGSQ